MAIDFSNLKSTFTAGSSMAGIMIILNYLRKCHEQHMIAEPDGEEYAALSAALTVVSHIGGILFKSLLEKLFPGEAKQIEAVIETVESKTTTVS